jgi:peroxiredoxin
MERALIAKSKLAQESASICLLDGSLEARLGAYANILRELNAPVAEAYDALVARLYAGEVGTSAPSVGDMMPLFSLPSVSGANVSLEDLTRDGPVVLSLNRGHWCSFCKIELNMLAGHHRSFSAHGAKVVSIIPEKIQYLDVMRNGEYESVLFLSDINNRYALVLGLVIWVGDMVKSLMQDQGYLLDERQGNDGWFLPVPATFVLDTNGRIVSRFVDADFRKRMPAEDILLALENIQKKSK